MNLMPIKLLLADDDKDDCYLFKDVLDELAMDVALTTVNDGESLMRLLTTKIDDLPDILFLDLNMPKKNGFECLSEIRNDTRFNAMTIIIFSTSFDKDIVKQLHDNGAQYYIRKPNEFSRLKAVIQTSLSAALAPEPAAASFDHFVLSA